MYSHVTLFGGDDAGFRAHLDGQLQQVIRPGMSIFSMVLPANSIAW